MQLHELKLEQKRAKKDKRIGRGNGSKKGTYATRGIKGQHSHTGWEKNPGFEGGQTPLKRKLPKLKGFNSANKTVFTIINLKDLKVFNDNEEVSLETLKNKKLIGRRIEDVKLLGSGELTKKLIIKIKNISGQAKTKIEASGSKIEN